MKTHCGREIAQGPGNNAPAAAVCATDRISLLSSCVIICASRQWGSGRTEIQWTKGVDVVIEVVGLVRARRFSRIGWLAAFRSRLPLYVASLCGAADLPVSDHTSNGKRVFSFGSLLISEEAIHLCESHPPPLHHGQTPRCKIASIAPIAPMHIEIAGHHGGLAGIRAQLACPGSPTPPRDPSWLSSPAASMRWHSKSKLVADMLSLGQLCRTSALHRKSDTIFRALLKDDGLTLRAASQD